MGFHETALTQINIVAFSIPITFIYLCGENFGLWQISTSIHNLLPKRQVGVYNKFLIKTRDPL